MDLNKLAMLFMYSENGNYFEHRVVVTDIPQMEIETVLKEQKDFRLRGAIEFYDFRDRKKIAEAFSRSYGWMPNESSRTIHGLHSSYSAIPLGQKDIIFPAFVNYFGPKRQGGFLSRLLPKRFI